MSNNINVPIMKSIISTAELLNLPVHFVRNLVKLNKVSYVMAGKKVLINFESVLKYLSEGDNKPETTNAETNSIRKIEV